MWQNEYQVLYVLYEKEARDYEINAQHLNYHKEEFKEGMECSIYKVNILTMLPYN